MQLYKWLETILEELVNQLEHTIKKTHPTTSQQKTHKFNIFPMFCQCNSHSLPFAWDNKGFEVAEDVVGASRLCSLGLTVDQVRHVSHSTIYSSM
jgi:hypothetical protein